jgi:O-antigen/teichoic acid export membrane protein
LRRLLPMLFPGLSGARFSALKDLTHPSLLFALLLIGNLIAFQGSTLIVSGVMGGLAVAVLSISRAMIDLIRQVFYSVTLALCPDFARMEALGKFDDLRKIHRVMVAATATITLALAASVWYEGPQIITVWTRGRIEPDVILLRLFLILLAFQTPWAASSTIGTATNRHSAQAIGYFFAAVIGVGVIALLVHTMGSWAVPVGLIAGEAVCCYHFVIQATCHTLGESYSAFALRFWLGFSAVTVAVLSTGWIVHAFMPGPTLVRWMTMGLLTLCAAVACGWIVWLTPADRASLSARLHTVLNFLPEGFTSALGVLKRSPRPEELMQ